MIHTMSIEEPRRASCIRIEITPVGQPRLNRADRWKQRPVALRYWAFANELRVHARKQNLTIPNAGLSLLFEMPMPESWSAKKRREMNGKPHQQKPDIDNLTKAVLDALCGGDDCTVWNLASLEKRWGEVGAITFTNHGE